MSENGLPHHGLVQPHIHYSFLKTASEGLSLSEEYFHPHIRDSLESDSKSLAQELQYQIEVQKRLRKREELVTQNNALKYESFEEDSLEENGVSEEEEVEEVHIPSRNNGGKENTTEKSKQELEDQYAELRYNPNWRNSKEGAAFLELRALQQKNDQNSPTLSLSSTSSSPRFEFVDKKQPPKKEQTENILSILMRESPDPPDQPEDLHHTSDPLHEDRSEGGRKLGVGGHYNSTSSLCSNGSSKARTFKEQKSDKDFVGKNKLTLGLPTPPHNSYLHLHSKRQRQDPHRQAPSCPGPQMGRTSTSPSPSFSGNPLHLPPGTQAEPRTGADHRHHNALELENTCGSSDSYGDSADFEDSRYLVHCGSNPNPAVSPLRISVINHSTVGRATQFDRDPGYIVHQNGHQFSTCLTLARNPLQPRSYENSSGFSKQKGQKSLRSPDDASGHQQHPCKCAVSKSLPGSREDLLRHKHFPHSYNAGLPQPANGHVSSQSLKTPKTPGSRPSGTSGAPPAPAHNLIRAPSPYTQLIQAAERHHQELSQLAGDHLARSQFAGVFPPIVQREESDPQLSMEGGKGGQSILNRWNSEGYLHQREKHKARKEKENSKGSRTKGYVKMDVKLGGLGPDYATIREKAEKIRQQKEYAKRVQEHNMVNLTATRKQLPTRPENKSSQSRQKALEYAKMIPKPKPAPSRPTEQEQSEERRLQRTSSRENLPPISSLESLQNRHEKEKQVVAAFRTLHIP